MLILRLNPPSKISWLADSGKGLTEQKIVVEHEIERVVALRQLVFSTRIDGSPKLHHLVFEQGKLRQEVRGI